jgi:hypothetical protein
MTEPYPLPLCEPGGADPDALADSIGAWARSPELAALVKHFGGDVPDLPTAALLDWLAEFSKVWDYRAGVKERFDTARVDFGDADVGLRLHIAALIRSGRPPARRAYDHVIVLGGGIRVALGRTEYAARLLADGLVTGTLAGLGSLRWRHEREHREAIRLGLDPVETEADMMRVAARRYLDLDEPADVRTGDGWWHSVWRLGRSNVGEVHVLAAASTRPPARANTADTLIGWAEHVHTPVASDRILLITNDPYVLHQHCDAIRLLGRHYGCGIETVGLDDAAMREWVRPLSTTELLQEVRSSLLAIRMLNG